MNTSQLILRARRLLDGARMTLAAGDVARASGVDSSAWAREARMRIARARVLWAAVTRAVALAAVTLRHTYKREGDAWRALVLADGATLWIGARLYGKRQSAQRRALRQADKIAKAAEKDYLCI